MPQALRDHVGSTENEIPILAGPRVKHAVCRLHDGRTWSRSGRPLYTEPLPSQTRQGQHTKMVRTVSVPSAVDPCPPSSPAGCTKTGPSKRIPDGAGLATQQQDEGQTSPAASGTIAGRAPRKGQIQVGRRPRGDVGAAAQSSAKRRTQYTQNPRRD